MKKLENLQKNYSCYRIILALIKSTPIISEEIVYKNSYSGIVAILNTTSKDYQELSFAAKYTHLGHGQI